jgi:multicomponent Na+:H+ antiporter subunit B
MSKSLISKLIGFLYPFMLLLAFYVILNGHRTPGGGFQGGAILASVFISRYLTYPYEDIKITVLQVLEKVFFIAIVLLPVVLLFVRPGLLTPPFDRIYLVVLNVLIGLKVGTGLTLIFFRFVFYEGAAS